MLSLAVEYFAFVFVAAVGVLQAAVNHSGLAGLSFFRRRWKAYLFSLLAVALSFSWFFLKGDRNHQGLEGFQQLILFSLSAFSALLFTLCLSSLINRHTPEEPDPEAGLEALRQASYWQVWRQRKGSGAGGG